MWPPLARITTCLVTTCMCGSRGGGGKRVRTPLKITKLFGFLSILVLIPCRTTSYQASIQCWATIVPPAKRHFKWRFAGGPMMAVLKWYLDPLSHHQLKKIVVKVGDPLNNGSAHDMVPAFFHIELRARLEPLNMFKPYSIFNDLSKAMLLLWIIFVINVCGCLCYTVLSVPCSKVITCWERAGLLARCV